MCNLYSITTNQGAIRALFRKVNRYVGNLAPMPGVFPDYPAPVIRNIEGNDEAELVMMRCVSQPTGPAINDRIIGARIASFVESSCALASGGAGSRDRRLCLAEDARPRNKCRTQVVDREELRLAASQRKFVTVTNLMQPGQHHAGRAFLFSVAHNGALSLSLTAANSSRVRLRSRSASRLQPQPHR
jgi:hypothetical protein